jgi:hypothetical protein
VKRIPLPKGWKQGFGTARLPRDVFSTFFMPIELKNLSVSVLEGFVVLKEAAYVKIGSLFKILFNILLS